MHPTENLHGDRPAAATEQGLADAKELAAAAFQRTRMPIVLTDARAPDNPIVLANQAFLKLTGYAAQEVVGRNCRFLQGPDTSPHAIAEIRAGLGQERITNVEILNYRKDGSTFWNRLHISPIHDEDGKLIYFFASQIDVTELRKVQALEASERRLLMEVEHRSKNVLAIVESIVRVSDARDPRAYAAVVRKRVQALSSVHSLFSERGWEDIPLGDVARLLVTPLCGARASFHGPPIRLSPVTLQPLGLIFHELASNAAAHGALTVPSGTVAVTWEADAAGLTIFWQESGLVGPAGGTQDGFGTVMIDATVERQLSGRIQRNRNNAGLTVTIALPELARLPA
ncbi:PAS domain S-box protein [Rhizobium sp. R339]|nr:PAS domain-containing protein [Rhizobium sp. R339]OWV65550.1 PAS domain S-box protein [Rhizobium sp. R339]